jgi:phage shock protein A
MRAQALADALVNQRNAASDAHANTQADLAVAVAMVKELREEIAGKDAQITALKTEIGTLTARLIEAKE